MTGPSPGAQERGPSSWPSRHENTLVEDSDGDEHADESLDSALLADDPLEGNGKAPYNYLTKPGNYPTDSLLECLSSASRSPPLDSPFQNF